jgi:tetratricopeptide (TPR) repeat protein
VNSDFFKTYGLFALAVIIVIVGVMGMLFSKKEPPAVETHVAAVAKLEPQAPPPPTPEEEIQTQIVKQQDEIEKDPKGEDTPAKLLAVCNLHMKVQNFDKAIEACLRFIADYPASPRVGEAYLQLSSCYKQRNDQAKLNRLYMDMMQKFPKESSEHEYAKQQLGL